MPSGLQSSLGGFIYRAPGVYKEISVLNFITVSYYFPRDGTLKHRDDGLNDTVLHNYTLARTLSEAVVDKEEIKTKYVVSHRHFRGGRVSIPGKPL
jgi:hypothetical protein